MTLVVAYTKFAEGAWIVTVAIPVLVLGMLGIRRHYDRLARRLRPGRPRSSPRRRARNTTLLLVEALDEATEAAPAVRARDLARRRARGARADARTDPGIRPRWFSAPACRSRRSTARLGVTEAVLEQVWRLPRGESDFVTVVVPELFGRESLARAGEASARARAEAAAARRARRRRRRRPRRARRGSGAEPQRWSRRVLVSGVNAASMRAVNYASALGIDDVRAVHFAFSAEDAASIRSEWARHGPRIPLEVDEAPYRDVGAPLLGYLRELTRSEGDGVLVLMPELVTRGWRRLLHNQRALYVKRLLLFEPGVDPRGGAVPAAAASHSED